MNPIKLIPVAAFALASLFLNSCGCCTGVEPAPPLRPMPAMKEIPTAREIPVIYEK